MSYRSLAERVGNAVRLAEVLKVLARHGFAHLVRASGLDDGIPARLLRELKLLDPPEAAPRSLGTRLASALCELGPTFVKFGQVLSTRPDLLPQQVCADLAELRDRVPSVPFEEIRAELEEDLGGAVDELFADFPREPIAAASMSQVYKASLPDGTPVAVKVRRPGIDEVVEADLALMTALAEWAEANLEEVAWTDPTKTVDEFARAIRRELDFSIEKRTLLMFAENFAGFPRVEVPRVHPALSSSRILTMDWVDGARVDDVEAYPGRDSDPREVARTGVEVVCTQVFEHRFFHADPHPGNIFLTRENRVTFLDYGMVGRLSEPDVHAMADLLAAAHAADPEACVEALLSFTVKGDVADRRALTHEVADYLAFEAQDIMASGQVGKAIEYLTGILRAHRLQLAPRFSLLMKALATIETTARTLDPNLDMLPLIRPHVERVITSRFAPGELRDQLEDELRRSMRTLRDMPADLHGVLRSARAGRLAFRLDLERFHDLVDVADRASNRLAFAIVSGALIVGSSLLMATEAGAPRLGLTGFIGAGLAGLLLIVSIMRSRAL